MDNRKMIKAVFTLGVLMALAIAGCGQVGEPDLTANGPDFPSGISANPGNGRVTLAWNAAGGATSYNVYYSTAPGVNAYSGILISALSSSTTTTSTFYTHSTVTNGIKYYYVVTAVNAKGESGESEEVSAMPLASLGKWTVKAPMRTARYQFASGVIGGNLYVFNGSGAAGYLSSVEYYTAATNTWTAVTGGTNATLNKAMRLQSGAVFGTSMYLVGGVTTSNFVTNAVVQYTPSTNTWTTRANMPTMRSALATCATTALVFAIGGWNGSSVIGTVEAYDPTLNTWTTKASMPTPRDYVTCSTVGSTIYVFGGRDGNGDELATVEAYNTLTNTWTTMAAMPTARRGAISVYSAPNIYVIGGYNANFFNLDITEIYNTGSNTWTSAESMPTARNALAGGLIGGSVYAVGGYDGWDIVDTVEMFTP